MKAEFELFKSAGMSRSTSKCLQVPSPAASVPCTACLIMTI